MATTKTKNVNFRINEDLRGRYEEALDRAGVTITDHLTMKILDFILMVDTKLPEREEKKAIAYLRVGNPRQIEKEKTP